MGKGRSPAPAGDQRVVQTNLPEYAQPYVERIMERAETESQRAYEPYEGQRIAGLSDYQQAGMYGMTGMGPGITGMQTAQGLTAGAANIAGQYADMTPGQFQAYQFGPTAFYGSQQAANVVGPDLAYSQGAFGPGGNPSAYGYGDVQEFPDGRVSEYMSPYMQNVVDVQKNRAQLDFDRAQAGRDATAVQQGAFGGSRSAVVNALAQEDLSRQMNELQATGQQAAYEDAQRMFEADRQARMQREDARAGELARVQQLGMQDYYNAMGQNLQARQLGFDVLARQEADFLAREQGQAAEYGRVQDAYDRSRFDAARIGLEGLGMQGALGAQLADLGGVERQAAMDYYGSLMDVGGMQRDVTQQYYDQAYQDFLAQQSYPREQLQYFNDIIRGNIRGNTTTTQQFAQANPFKDLLGAGITGISLANIRN